MKLIYTVLILLLFVSVSAEMVQIKIINSNDDLINWLKETGNSDFRILPDYLDLYIQETELPYIEENYEYSIVSTESDWNRSIGDYKTYDQILTELANIAADNPGFTDLISLGNTLGHQYYDDGYGNYDDFQFDIKCIKLSDNPDIDEDEPNIFMAGAIHSREPTSMEVDMYILHHIVDNYGIDPEITYLVDNSQIWFIPLINPDGYRMVRELNYLGHRKNIRDNDGDGIADGALNLSYSIDGVDLNRNFGYTYGGTSSYSSQSYNGAYAWSEPESAHLRDLIRAHRFWGGITYHSSGQLVLYPIGSSSSSCSYDHEIMHVLAEEMAYTIPRYSSSGSLLGNYIPDQATRLPAKGTMGDWGYAEQRLFSYTVELGWTHILADSWIDQICEDNLEAALIFLNRVHYSTVTGNITSETRSPLVAEIYVQEIDFEPGMTSVEPVRSDSTYGRYFRSLLPGSYTFTFSSEGYNDIVIENVIVNDSTQTELNVNFTTLPAPYVVNPLSSISFGEDTSDNSIDLNTVFAIDDEQELVYTYSNNTNIAVQITAGLVELTPEPNWNGEDTIIFYAIGENNQSASEDLQVFVTPLNDPPYVASPITDFSFMEDTSDNSIDLNTVFEDVDMETRESLAFSYSGNDTISVVINSGLVILTPAVDWFGSEEIIFTATDDSLASASDTVLVTVNAVNDTPFIDLPDSIFIIMNAIYEEDFNQYISDIEGDSLTLISIEPVNITTEVNDLTVTITPDSNWVGDEIVYFMVNDEVRSINSDSIKIIVYADFLTKPVVNSIYLMEGTLRIEWDPIPGATEYVIYSSDNPLSGFVIDDTGIFED
ncbi:M14 family zinc carboxypeptidase, partial [Candidatus Cloacimonadota bacterium]